MNPYTDWVNVLVTGGSGYIGAHIVRLLAERGDRVVIADDLATGDRGRIPGFPLLEVELSTDAAATRLAETMTDHGTEAVVHLAARKQVGESVARPAWYYRQNVGSLANVLLAMETAGVRSLVFSSSASVYGPSESAEIAEDAATAPTSPYGETKLAGERLVEDAASALGLSALSLRYFNVAGAGWPDLGDTAVLNLVPMVFEKLDAGEPPAIFGADYPTPDGTCVRDYVHVLDVAEAHLAALDGLAGLGTGHQAFNIGTGRGSSVREIVDRILEVAAVETEPAVLPRRPGDPPSVVAAVDRIREKLGWSARFGLDDIIRSAWESHEYLRKAGRP